MEKNSVNNPSSLLDIIIDSDALFHEKIKRKIQKVENRKIWEKTKKNFDCPEYVMLNYMAATLGGHWIYTPQGDGDYEGCTWEEIQKEIDILIAHSEENENLNDVFWFDDRTYKMVVEKYPRFK